jgi:hypothetical protein
MQGIHTYIPETNNDLRDHCVATILTIIIIIIIIIISGRADCSASV